MRSTPVVRLDSEFDAFLFAPVGEGGNGVLLSVVSALVRLDLDPWKEAANLAQLPMKAAAERLASLIATLPDDDLVPSDPAEIADRLVGLLPRQGGIKVPVPSSVRSFISSKAQVVAVCAAILICLVVAHWLFGSQAPPIGATAPAASTVSP